VLAASALFAAPGFQSRLDFDVLHDVLLVVRFIEG